MPVDMLKEPDGKEPTILLRDYLRANSPNIYREFEFYGGQARPILRKRYSQGRRTGDTAVHSSQDDVFGTIWNVVKTPSEPQDTWRHFDRYKDIAADINRHTQALQLLPNQGPPPHVLDLCSAPRGFLRTVLDLNPRAFAHALSLPEADGGFEFLMPRDENINFQYANVTNLPEEIGVKRIDYPADSDVLPVLEPRQLPEKAKFQLVICDGSVGAGQFSDFDQKRERRRLRAAQLSIALNNIKPGGTIIMLLTFIEHYDTAQVLYQFSQFSLLQTHKPTVTHNSRASFYMISKNVRSDSKEAKAALLWWQREWKAASDGQPASKATEQDVQRLISEFGSQLISFGSNVWTTQTQSFKRAIDPQQSRSWKSKTWRRT